jgi:uncharacterized protein (TIGR03083 family)
VTDSSYDDLVGLIADTASRLVTTVLALTEPQWHAPGLGEWDVRELIGHTIRAFSTIDRFLDTPVDDVAVDVVAYYRTALSTPGVHAAVAQRGREGGESLGDDPKEAVVEQVTSTLGRLDDTDGTEVGMTAVGGMTLAEYLETRLVELVVHYSDLCHALGVPVGDLGAARVRAATTVFASALDDDQDAILRAMLGRAGLPSGFSVWP